MQWVDVCADEELGEEPLEVKAGARDIALYRVDGDVFATAARCTHGNASLCDGYLEAGEIECPLHQGRFDVRTGKALCAPLTHDVAVYPVQRANDRILVAIAE